MGRQEVVKLLLDTHALLWWATLQAAREAAEHLHARC
jgi:PIN domain nuclease of toxin-antitoxin system